MNERESKLVVATRPVNRRTAARPPAPAAATGVLKTRLLARRARKQLGAPLSEQLMARPPSLAPVAARVISGAVIAACAVVGIFLAWLQRSTTLASASAAGLAAGLWLVHAGRSHAAQRTGEEPSADPLLEIKSAEAFDRVLDALDGETPSNLHQALANLKQVLVRLAKHPSAAKADEYFTAEDRFYVRECVRRYVPDSLQAYLAVPAANRDQAPGGEGSPQAIVLGQIALLTAELEAREAKLTRSATEALHRQERFLQSKRKP